MTAEKAPAGLGRRGRRFWRQIRAAYDLSVAELELVLEVARTLDVIEDLATKADPRSLAEARQQRLVLGRLLAQLAIPEPEGGVERPTKRRAREAAEKRWAGHVRRRNA